MTVTNYGKVTVSHGVTAAADLTAGQLVDFTGAIATAAAYGYPITDDAATGETANLAMGGITTVACSAAVAAGALVEVSTTGRVVTQSAGVTIGRAITATSAADQKLLIQIIPH